MAAPIEKRPSSRIDWILSGLIWLESIGNRMICFAIRSLDIRSSRIQFNDLYSAVITTHKARIDGHFK